MTLKRFVTALGIVSVLAFVVRYVAKQKASGLSAIQKGELLVAVQAAHTSTLDALDPSHESTDDFEARDARAAADAAALERAYTASRSAIAPWLLPTVTSFVEAVTAAQVKIMAFAINRKNRGPSDVAHTEPKNEDRTEFARDTAPLLTRLSEVLS